MEYQEVIKKICQEENIKLTTVSNNWVNILEYNNKIKFIVGYTFGLNKDSVAKILDDKYALYSVLNNYHLNIIKHHLLYKDYAKDEVKKLFLKYQQDVVIKANLGYAGTEVFHVKNLKKLYQIMDKLFIKNYSLSLCPYYEINYEYRIIVLNKEIKLIYQKIRPIVLGDGVKTYQELLEEFNPQYFQKHFVSKKVLKKGEVKEYSWQFNLSKGAKALLVDNLEVINKLENMVKDILNVIDLNFASIDIVEINNEYKVMEINNGVTLTKFMNMAQENYNLAYNIYKEAIKSLFKEE